MIFLLFLLQCFLLPLVVVVVVVLVLVLGGG
jgi:hypothetical protein